jgi:hypothetical protein
VSSTIKAGTVVYRVIEVDPPTDEPHTWKVAAIVVESATAKQVKFKAPGFPGSFRKIFKPDALGRAFFETPLQAIEHFLVSQRLEIVALDRKRKEADRAIAWATSQESMKS